MLNSVSPPYDVLFMHTDILKQTSLSTKFHTVNEVRMACIPHVILVVTANYTPHPKG